MRILQTDVDLVVEVDPDALAWPTGSIEDSSGNRSWVNLAGVRWRDVDAALRVEAEMLERCTHAAELWSCARTCDDEIFEMYGVDLDLGTVAATLALNAARCASSMACIGHGRYAAYVQFWARPPKVPLLMEAARAAGVGLVNHSGGGIEVYSTELDGLFRFGTQVRARSQALRMARSGRRTCAPSVQQQQLHLEIRPSVVGRM